jgi:hypothetical protein
MPVARLKLFEFLTQYLSHVPFWCERLALVQPGDKRDSNSAGLKEDDQHIWQAMRTQLSDVLAQEQTLQAFMAYLVENKRAHHVDSPVHSAEDELRAQSVRGPQEGRGVDLSAIRL